MAYTRSSLRWRGWSLKHGLSADENEAYASTAKLTKYDIEDVLCYHGGLFTGNAQERIAGLASIAPDGEER